MADTKIVELPFTYTVEGCTRNGKEVRVHSLVDTVMVAIPIVGKADAPIVLSAGNATRGFPFEMRRYDGVNYCIVDSATRRPRNWKKVAIVWRGDVGRMVDGRVWLNITPKNIDELLAGVLDGSTEIVWPHYPLPMENDGEGPRDCKVVRLPNRRVAGFKHVVRDDHDAAAAKAHAGAAGLLFVDDRLYTREEEPFLQISPSLRGRGRQSPDVFVIRAWDDWVMPGCSFGLGRVADARRLAEDVYGSCTLDQFRIDPSLVWERDHDGFETRRWARSCALMLENAPSGMFWRSAELAALRDVADGPAKIDMNGLVELVEGIAKEAPAKGTWSPKLLVESARLYRRRLEMFGNPGSPELDDLVV